MLDTRIIGGTIVDGTGSPGFAGDLGIRDGRIVAIGTVTEAARETIDASGRVVAPGFIDAHTHYDAQVFWDPKLTPSCFHGVTTVIGGFCGFSIAPLTAESGPYIRRMLSRVEGMPLETLEAVSDWGWSSFGDYLDRVEGGLGLNAGFFVGHSAIRRAVMGPRAVGEKADAAEIAAMQDLLDRSLAEGALGFSTTTSPTHNDYEGQPVPSRWAEREEFLALASVVAKHEGTGLELLPDLDKLESTADLMAEFSLAGQRPVNWNVLVVNGKANAAEIAARQLSISDTARARGGEVIALTMPRTPGVYMSLKNGMMFDVLPGLWREVFKLPIPERIEKFRDPEVRRQLAADAELIPADSGLKSFATLATYTVVSSTNARHDGRQVAAIAAEEGKSAVDAFFDIAVADGLATVFSPDQGGHDRASWELRGRLWADDRTLVGASDAGAHLDLIDSFDYATTVLGKGVREEKIIALEAAVHQLTARPAAYFGLIDRGLIREGYHADVVVFDPDTIAGQPIGRRYDLPGGNEYRIYAEAVGIDHVLVGGVEIVRHGEHTGALPGTLLRSGRDTRTVPMDVMRQATPGR
ncbi:amidohydrolase family protein [Novosphingobium sp. G106]|uniref:N-acyl-D-amino-acid deacylase family protein n=1 Tax=Novosphingobium sp. G106 TaxID=2849500 RepID=UPI001C2D3AD4|nr:amidohydrolase family protein [Novosphingobium sp. G106]MBV1691196.1 amidohydrolase family protein [Novosphingobium sp. G106]